MFHEITYELEHSFDMCVICDCDLKAGERVVVFYEDWSRPMMAHTGKCWEKYKELLYGEEEVKKGRILGLCGRCARPVRDDHSFGHVFSCPNVVDRKTIIPTKENGIEFECFVHDSCWEGLNS